MLHKCLACAAALAACWVGSDAHAVAFTPGNLAVYRVGDGSGAITTAAVSVFIDEYTTSGTLVQSIPMPTSVTGSQRRFTAQGTATLEGLLNLSTDGRYLLATGYDADVATAAPATTLSSDVNRVVARIGLDGVPDTSTVLTDIDDGFGTESGSPRTAISTNGTDIWATGAEGGVRYTTFGSTAASTAVSMGNGNLRDIEIFADQLYISTAATTGAPSAVGSVGTGVPTSTGNAITNLPGVAGGTVSAVQFFMADLSVGETGLDTLYISHDGAPALQKYSLVAGTWTSNGSVGVNADDYRGLTGSVSGSTVTLYATRDRASNADDIIALTDASGYNGALTGTPSVLATMSSSTNFRLKGIDFVPIVGTTPVGVAGDYNNNGTVDAADYVLWRNGGPLQNDPTAGVAPADYDFWKSRFGATSGSGSGLNGGAVPEPASIVLVLMGLAFVGSRRRAA